MKKLALLTFLMSLTTIVFGQDFTENTKIGTTSGIGLGSIIVVVYPNGIVINLFCSLFHTVS